MANISASYCAHCTDLKQTDAGFVTAKEGIWIEQVAAEDWQRGVYVLHPLLIVSVTVLWLSIFFTCQLILYVTEWHFLSLSFTYLCPFNFANHHRGRGITWQMLMIDWLIDDVISHVGWGEGETAASQVHAAWTAESDQEGAGNGERR